MINTKSKHVTDKSEWTKIQNIRGYNIHVTRRMIYHEEGHKKKQKIDKHDSSLENTTLTKDSRI